LALGLGLLVTLTFGIAHGALDHELAERLHGASKRTTIRIVFGYAAVVACAFTAFVVFPLPLFAAFIVISIVHFGSADLTFAARYVGEDLPRFARLRTVGFGALPIAVPFLAHPLEMLALVPQSIGFAVASVPLVPFAVRAAMLSIVGIVVVVAASKRAARARAARLPRWYVFELPVAFVAFVVAPPLPAFLLYFGCWHGARHLLRLAEVYGIDVNASFARNRVAMQSFALRSLPMTLGALALAVFFASEIPRTFSFSTAIVGFAFAVTVPHMLAVRYMDRAAAA
jgi:Brp/Blh family beta-carotene 15,15'-monooxygenase